MTRKEENPRDAPCTRCGKEAGCRFVDDDKVLVEVVCSDCGTFRVPAAEFEIDEFEIVEAPERER